MALLHYIPPSFPSLLFDNKSPSSQRRICQNAKRKSVRVRRGESWLLPDIVEASCLITPPFTPTTLPWSRPVRKLPTVSIGRTFSFSSNTRFLGLLMAGCRFLLTASLLSSTVLLAATLKITFMLCVEQLPPTLRCRSRLLDVDMK